MALDILDVKSLPCTSKVVKVDIVFLVNKEWSDWYWTKPIDWRKIESLIGQYQLDCFKRTRTW